jgi:hypothetical protein
MSTEIEFNLTEVKKEERKELQSDFVDRLGVLLEEILEELTAAEIIGILTVTIRALTENN